MKEIVFLDFDGVIFPDDSYEIPSVEAVINSPYHFFDMFVGSADKLAVKDLNIFMKDKLPVIISSWRYLVDEDFMIELLNEIGIERVHNVAVSKYKTRKEHDIQDYLHRSEYVGTWYLIDDEEELPDYPAGGVLIKPNPKIGFRLSDANAFNNT